MKLTPLLEERNNKPFMLHVQQRLLDDWDVEAELAFEDDDRFELTYSYDPTDDGDGRVVNVSISCTADGDNVLIDVCSDSFQDDDQVDLNIEHVMTKISSLTNRAEATLSDCD